MFKKILATLTQEQCFVQEHHSHTEWNFNFFCFIFSVPIDKKNNKNSVVYLNLVYIACTLPPKQFK